MKRLVVPLALAAAMAFAVWLRLIPTSDVFPESGPVRFVSADCEMHFLRVENVLRGEPIRVFDPDLNYPFGGIAIWPPLFDLAAAAFVRLFPRDWPADAAAAFFPVLLGALVPLLGFVLARAVLPRRWALSAAFWCAAMPALLNYSQLGHLDQHVGEALLSAAGIAALARARRCGAAIAAGVAIGLYPLLWQGGIFLAPVAMAAWLGGALAARRWPTVEVANSTFGTATVIATIGTALALRGEPPVPFTYVSISWFQPAFLALCWAAAALLTLAPNRGLARAWLGIGAGVVALVLAGPELLARVRDAVGHFGISEPTALMDRGGYLRYPAGWLRVIAEYRPLWPPAELLAAGRGLYTLLGVIAVPVAAWRWTRDAWRFRDARAAVLLVGSAAHVVLAVLQRRFGYDAAIFVAVAIVVAVRWAVIALSRRALPSTVQSALRRAIPVALIVGVGICWPSWRALPSTIQQPIGDSARFLLRIRQEINAPARDSAGRAAWGALTPWALGHTFRRWTGLPVAADNFGYGFEDQARVWLATSDDAALDVLRRRHVRYVLSVPFDFILPTYAAALDLPPPGADALGPRLFRGDVDRSVFREVLASRSGDQLADGRIVPRYRLWEVVAVAADSR